MVEALRRGRPTVGARLGGRSERVVREVLQATMAVLAETGYAAMRIEDVADRAGVNKTTIYRRWPTKGELVSAAVQAMKAHEDMIPDLGDLRADLVEHLARVLRFVRTDEGHAVMRLITTERGDPHIEALARSLRKDAMERRLVFVERAIARGELDANVPGPMLLEVIIAPIMSRVIRFEEHVDEATLRAIVDLVVTGAENGGGTKRRHARVGQ